MVCWPPSPSLVASPLKANTSANSPSSLSAPQYCPSDAPPLRNHKSAANVSDKLLRSHALTVICRSLIKRLTLAAAFAAAFFARRFTHAICISGKPPIVVGNLLFYLLMPSYQTAFHIIHTTKQVITDDRCRFFRSKADVG